MSGAQTIATTIAGPLAISGRAVSVTAAGGVTAAGYAVTLTAGTLVNDGLVSGTGIGVIGSGFVTNAGTITGGGAYALSFASGATSALVVDPGARFVGVVQGGGVASALEFAGTGAATLAGLGSHYTGFGTIDVALGADWTAAGGNSLGAGQAVATYGKLVSAGTLTNAGTIAAARSGTGVGIYFAGGALTNSGALYGAGNGLRATDGFGGTVTNTGLVTASTTGTGAYLYDATFLNSSGGTVSGATGIDLGLTASLVNNALVSGSAAGVYDAGGAATNAAGATIAGGSTGFGGYGLLVNAGTITAASAQGFAVSFVSTHDSRLVVDPGAVFTGMVDGGNPSGSTHTATLEFAPGAGTFAGFGSTVEGFGQVSLDPGARWLLTGTATGFEGGETIAGFAPGSTIELTGTTAAYGTLSGGVLTLSGGTTLALPGLVHANVTASGGNTFITACFATGTRITTESGAVAVEMLKPGDRVLTATGRLAPIRWIGWRRTDIAAHPRAREVTPVRICRGAFGGGLPWHDLVLSPDHAVLVDGALIPVRYLVNGASIVEAPRDEVTYWHVELDRHDVILAEGLACESYLDTGNRGAFDNAPGAIAMVPSFARGVWVREGCAPILTDTAEPRLRAVHTRVLAYAQAAGDEALALRRA